jgi:hypothetical protein
MNHLPIYEMPLCKIVHIRSFERATSLRGEGAKPRALSRREVAGSPKSHLGDRRLANQAQRLNILLDQNCREKQASGAGNTPKTSP